MPPLAADPADARRALARPLGPPVARGRGLQQQKETAAEGDNYNTNGV